MTFVTELPERGAIEIAGEDRVAFLQGLVSNDVAKAAPGRAVWAAMLTPQGKWLADFFIVVPPNQTLLLDCERAQIPMLVQRLSRYRLRSRVSIAARDDLLVAVAWGGEPPAGGIVAADPRLPEAGFRVLSDAPVIANATSAEWNRHRLSLGLPDGSRDLEADKTVLLEAGFDELSGVSWTKGCYMGQELTARTKYRGLLKRRLVPVSVDGPLPPPGTPVLRRGVDVGTMRSGQDGTGLAVLRLDALGDALECGAARMTARVPQWMKLPEPSC